MDNRVHELPFVVDLPVIRPFRLVVEKVDRVVVGIIVGAETEAFYAVLVQSVQILGADLCTFVLFPVEECLVKTVHPLCGKFRA